MLGVNLKNMLVGKKIALLCGLGTMGRAMCAVTDAVNLVETKTQNAFLGIDVLKLMDYKDYSLLVKAYKKVQRKYYPEKDVVFINKYIRDYKC